MNFRLLACLVVSGLSLGLTACSDESPAPIPEAPVVPSGEALPWAEEAQDVGSEALEEAGEVVDQVKDSAEEAPAEIQDGAEEGTEEIDGAAGGISQETSTVISETGRQAAQGGGQAGVVRQGAIRTLEDAGVDLNNK